MAVFIHLNRIRQEFLATALLVLFMNHSSAAVTGPPRKLSISDDKRVLLASLGYPFVLRCPVEMSSSLYVDWSRDNVSTLYMEDGYKITGRGALKVINVTKHHEGHYTCHAINGYGTVDVNLTLIVDESDVNRSSTRQIQNTTGRQMGIAPSFKKKHSIALSEEIGRSVALYCEASGYPTPYIFFFKEGVLRNEATKGKMHSTLRIKDLKKSDAGIYTCVAKNKIGEAHLDFRLEVTDPIGPPKIVALTPLVATIKTSVTATFSCEVSSKPGLNLHIKWFKRLTDDEMRESQALDDITLFQSNSLFYRPLNKSESIVTQDGIYKSKLMIQNTVEDDSGTYVCFALNDRGFVFKNTTLNVVNTEIYHSGTLYKEDILNSLSFAMPVILLISLLTLIIVFLFLRRKIITSQKRITSELPATCVERECLKQDVSVSCVKCNDS